MIAAREADKVPKGCKRSPKWRAVRRAFLKKNPYCQVCGGKKKLEVHHIKPFHLDTALELDPSNMITLCENKLSGVNCHLLFGHLGNYQSFNETVVEDAKSWSEKLKERPNSKRTNGSSTSITPISSTT